MVFWELEAEEHGYPNASMKSNYQLTGQSLKYYPHMVLMYLVFGNSC